VYYWAHLHQTLSTDAFWDKDECHMFGSRWRSSRSWWDQMFANFYAQQQILL